jgi:hypothetical protein
MGVSGQCHAPAALPRGKASLYQSGRRLGSLDKRLEKLRLQYTIKRLFVS